MFSLCRLFTSLLVLALLATAGLFLACYREEARPLAVAFFVFMMLALKAHPSLRSFAFTASVLVSVSTALLYPAVFMSWGRFNPKELIVPLTQIIMFGMGTTLTLADFDRVMKFPWPVCVGLVLHFTVMPLVAVVITHVFGFTGELAAGVVLIGSVSAGMASNLMCYLAKGNVALSVTMTLFSTLAAPFLTPLLMQWLAGQYIPVHMFEMMVSIVNMILVPIAAGLVANAILYRQAAWNCSVPVLLLIILGCALLACLADQVPAEWLGGWAKLKSGVAVGGAMVGVVALARIVVSLLLRKGDTWMDATLPVVSMSAITLVVGIITVQTREVLLSVGPVLVLASLLHNLTGYTLGYWGARLLGGRMTEADCRTVAIEVGMQNGGMATGIAIDVLHSHVAALPPGIFGTTMNITGSLLANFWKRRPPTTAPEAREDVAFRPHG